MSDEIFNISITKKCVYCGEDKLLSEFHNKHSGKYSKDSRCKICKNERQKRVKYILKHQAPPKPIQSICGCCGKHTEKLVPDHDDKNNKFRGWICENCNTGIGKLGDDIGGLQIAIDYLKRTTDYE